MAQQSLIPPHSVTMSSTLSTKSIRVPDHPVHKTLANASNLANLLPTGTVLAFQALIPSFTNNGSCQVANQYLTAFLIAFCGLTCFISSFTDSFSGVDGKLYYGMATFKGLYIFNNNNVGNESVGVGEENNKMDLGRYKLGLIDFVHAFMSLFVLLIFAVSNTVVQECLFPNGGDNEKVLIMNLPLGAGVLSSFFFTIFPTTRRGIGYGDIITNLTN